MLGCFLSVLFQRAQEKAGRFQNLDNDWMPSEQRGARLCGAGHLEETLSGQSYEWVGIWHSRLSLGESEFKMASYLKKMVFKAAGVK